MKSLYACLLAAVIAAPFTARAQTEVVLVPKPQKEAREAETVLRNAPANEDAQKEQLKRVSTYLNGIKSMVAVFKQTDDTGQRESGRFYMKRPSQARWEYNAPSPLTLIANGGFLAIVDRELEEVRHVPADSALSNIISANKIDLLNNKMIAVDDVIDAGDSLHVILYKKKAKHEGTLTLHFSDGDSGLALTGFTQLDAAGRTTALTFSNTDINISVPKSKFDIPEYNRKRGR